MKTILWLGTKIIRSTLIRKTLSLKLLLIFLMHFSNANELDLNAPKSLNSRTLIGYYTQNITLLEQTNIVNLVAIEDILKIDLPTDPETLNLLRKATQILLMRESGSVVFTGAPGVGKSYQLNLMLAYLNAHAPEELRNRLYMRGMASAFASRKDGNAGVVEENVKQLIALSRRIPITLILDELHTLQGAGSHKNTSVDVLEMLKESLATGHIRIIGTTTDYEFEQYFGNRPALMQRFVKLNIDEPKKVDLILILKKRYYEDTNSLLSEVVLNQLLLISEVFGGTFAEPRRSLKLLDYLISVEKLDNHKIETPEDTTKYASEYYNMDLNLFLDPNKTSELIFNAEKAIREKLIGLDQSILETFKSINFWMNQEQRTKPLTLLMYGGKGTGKTFFSSSIAESLHYKFFKISMQNTSRADLMSQIATQLEMYPFTVFLLDEIEKSDPKTQQALLNVLDSASVNQQKLLSTGERGAVVSVSTKNAIFLFTTNAGETFAHEELSSEFAMQKISELESIDKYLLDRIKKAIPFVPPNTNDLYKLVDMKWKKVAHRFLKEAEDLGINVDYVFKKIIEQYKNKIASGVLKSPIGFLPRAAENLNSTEDLIDLSHISVRSVENTIELIAEDAYFKIKNPKPIAKPNTVEKSAFGNFCKILLSKTTDKTTN